MSLCSRHCTFKADIRPILAIICNFASEEATGPPLQWADIVTIEATDST